MDRNKPAPEIEPARHWIDGEWVGSLHSSKIHKTFYGEALGEYSAGGRVEPAATNHLRAGENSMTGKLDNQALDQLYRAARTRNAWTEQPLTEQQLRELYDLMKFGPTSGNCCPARFVWVRSAEGKHRLAALAAPTNAPKILEAPVTVIVGYDLDFAEQLPKLFPARGKDMQAHYSDPLVAQTTAFRNGSLQGAYLIIAARALGLDCGPMSGFNNEAVDSEFFANTRIKSNFICSVGYWSNENIFPRNPRLTFEEAGRFA